MPRFEPLLEENTEYVRRIAQENDIAPLLASLLINRGLTQPEEIRAFLRPEQTQLLNPFDLLGMQEAVARLEAAKRSQEHVCVYGDYDADGVCAAAILVSFLQQEGYHCSYYLPSRHAEGYGMNREAAVRLASEGVGLVVTVDNGIAAKEEVALCTKLGMDVIVTDHHQCPDELPECVAVINPHRKDSIYQNRDLCGAGVAFKLIQALKATQAQLQACLPLAALATVADIVPLRGENRAIVSLGLPLVKKHPGLAALLAVSGSAGQEVTSETLAFRLAPRINAAGRMGDAKRALELLLAREEEKAQALALILNEENERRQEEERGILQDARRMLQQKDVATRRAILLYSPDWSPGVIGIVASKLVEEYYKPVLLFHLNDGMLIGSCRSIPGVHLYTCLDAFGERFVRFGGHAQAAGLTMELDAFEAFAADFNAHLTKTYPASVFVPTYRYECVLNLPQLTLQTAQELSVLAPYGEGNPQPVFYAGRVVMEGVETMGRDGAHLRADVVQEGRALRMVAFGKGKESLRYGGGGEWNLLYAPEVNVWQNKARLQLMLRAIHPVSILERPETLENGALKFYDAFFRNFLYNDTCGVDTIPVLDMDAAIIQALERELSGTLVLCFTQGGAERLRKLLYSRSSFDLVEAAFHTLPAGIGTGNAVLFAPYLDGAAFSHARIFVYDGGMTLPARLCPGAVFVPELYGQEQVLAPLTLSREEMGYLYQAFLSRLKRGAAARMELVSLPTVYSREAAILALLVFVELGFLRWDAKDDRITAPAEITPRSLQESKLYAAANIG